MTKSLVPSLRSPTPEIIARLTNIVGPTNALTDPNLQQPYLIEWRDRYVGKTPLVLRPSTTSHVSKILALANEEKIGIVPQGGNTGLVGGQIPHQTNTEIVVTTENLKGIRNVDSLGQFAVVESGVTLTDVRNLAEKHNRTFPLSLASEGSCQIGGNLATNAGGINVLSYGNARDLVFGLEVVLANGRIWDGLRTLKKDNTGYDLKHLFMGSEGTLGIITAAALKLFPNPTNQATSIVAINNLEDTLALFDHAESNFGTLMTAFEFMSRTALEFVTDHLESARHPFSKTHPWYAIIEFSSQNETGASLAMESFLQTALNENKIIEAAIASSLNQKNEIWQLREEISPAQKPEGGSIKHDISVPVSLIPKFIASANKIVEKLCRDARPVPFGHFGDGNIHYNVSQPKHMDKTDFLKLWEPMNEAIHDLVAQLGGSFSAEHGIGRMKRADLIRYKSAEELALMRTIKHALDPNGILNPGKLL